MPWNYTDEYYREYTRTTWNDSAEAYVEFMRNLAPFRSDLVARLDAQPGEEILDLGTGPGPPCSRRRPPRDHGAVGPDKSPARLFPDP